MSIIRIKRGLEANRSTVTPAEAELIYTTDNKELFVGDGVTAGGTNIKQTALELLNAIKTVDGPGSGLDSDLLDGVNGASYAQLASPTLTGNPTAPTQAAGNNTTRLATTAFVLENASNIGELSWIQFTGTGVINNNGTNISSVTILGTGTYQINFTAALPTDKYGVVNGFDGGAIAGSTPSVQYGFSTVSDVRIIARTFGNLSSAMTTISTAIHL